MNVVQQVLLVVLRVAIGWHFLYEGYVKITDKAWSAGPYLAAAQGPLAGVFHAIAQNDGMLRAVNLLNAWGLTAAGACLILGLLTPVACLGAVLLLALYYAANPPWIAVLPMATEGNYLMVDKNLVELLALCVVLAFNTGRIAGLDLLYYEWRGRRKAKAAA
ncbi:MAG: DoxX family membrane protein [Armatimonadota bacterium]|nr:MAG: DoxX family membrane protein [Armatimonadota bacterium]